MSNNSPNADAATDWVPFSELAKQATAAEAKPVRGPEEAPAASPTWGDYGRHVGAEAVDTLGAAPLQLGRYAAEAAGDGVTARYLGANAELVHQSSDAIREGMTPAMKARLAETTSDPAFWEHIGSSVAIRSAGMAPAMIAMAIPAGLFADATAAVVGSAAVGGAINAAGALDDFYKKVDALSDEELQKQSSVYRGMRTMMDENDARIQYNQTIQGLKPALNFAIGAAATSIGPAGTIARGGVAGAAERGVMGRAGVGAAEGVTGNVAQSGVADITTQHAEIEGGLRDQFDYSQFGNKLAEAALLGGVTGGIAGAATRGHGEERPTNDERKPELKDHEQPAEQPPEQSTEPNEQETTAPPAAEAAPVAEQQPKQQPEQPKPRKQAKAKPAPQAETVEANTPTDEQKAALAASNKTPSAAQEEPKASTPPVAPPAEVSQRPTDQLPDQVTRQDATGQVMPDAPQAAASGVPHEGRILPDLTQDAEARGQVADLKPNLADVQESEARTEAATKRAITGEVEAPKGNRTGAEKDAKASTAEFAERKFNEVVKKDEVFPVTQAQRAQFMDRIRGVVNDAKNEGIKIPARPGRDETAKHVLWLSEAQRLARKDKPRPDDIANFLMMEKQGLAGDWAGIRANRIQEGNEKLQKAGRGKDVEQVAEESTPEVEGTEGKIASDHRAENQDLGATTTDSAKMGVRGLDDGTETVNGTTRAKAASAGRSLKDMSPEEKAKLLALYNTKGPDASLARVPKTRDGKFIASSDAGKVVAEGAHTLSQALDKFGGGEKSSDLVRKFMRGRVKELVGDVPVLVVHSSKFKDLVPELVKRVEADEHGHTIGGYYDPTKHHIVVASELMGTKAANDILVHEAAHAVTSRILHTDKKFNDIVEAMRRRALDHIKQGNDLLDAVGSGIGTAAEHEKVPYGLTNTREFIAELYANPDFQRLLTRINVDSDLRKLLDDVFGPTNKRVKTLWDGLVDFIRKYLGMRPDEHNLLEAAMRVSAHLESRFISTEKAAAAESGVPNHVSSIDPYITKKLSDHVTTGVTDAVERVVGKGRQHQLGSPKLLGWRTMDNIAQAADHFFGRDNNPVRKIADLIEMAHVDSQRRLQKSEPIVTKLYEAQRKYAGKQWDAFTSLLHDETMASVDASKSLAGNAHLGMDTLRGAWSKAQHGELSKRYEALPQELKDLRGQALKYFTDTQREMSLGLINNRLLKAVGMDDKALAERILDGTMTDADKAKFDPHTLELIEEAGELASAKGPYVPLMRRGNYVVRGTYKIKDPTNALRKVDSNTWEFASRDEALKFGNAQDNRPTVKSVWVDKNTGEKFVKDKDGKEVRITPQDVDAEQRFRVTVQDRHVEFHDTKDQALKAAAALEDHPAIKDVKGVEERRFEPGDRQADMMSTQLKRMVEGLEKRNTFKGLSDVQKNELVQTLNEMSIRVLGSTRIQSKRLPRTYVEGYSQDLTRNALDYAQSSSSYLAKLQHQPQLEDAMKAMDDAVGAGAREKSMGKRSIANEIEKRVRGNNGFNETDKYSPYTKRLLTISFLDKLFSPANSIINATQPAMVTMPVLAGRYGAAKSFAELGRAYRDISALKTVGQGLRDTARKTKDTTADTANLIEDIKSRLTNKREREMLDYLAERGSIDPEAGLEIASMIKQRGGILGGVDKGIGYLEGIARQMPKSIEAINRATTALAAYRLEMRKNGGNHEAAMRHAQETVNNTQFLYSGTNAAPIFNHPLLKLALQFKKFGQGMYQLMGQQVGKIIRNGTPGERAEGIKTLAGIASAHAVMAGALGLPVEPIKFLLLGAQAAGLTSTGWSDVESEVRKLLVDVTGSKGLSEVLAKGAPRAFGLDLSTRLGGDSYMSFGEPKSNKDTDVKSWLFDTIAGAPVALLGDWIKGANAIHNGDFEKAGELMIPVKFIADSMRAGRQMSEGKKNNTGRETSKPYSLGEAATRAIGFTPRREAEEGEKRSAYYSQQNRDKDARSGLITKWVTAKPADKAAALKAVQEFNKGKPRDAQISMSDLTSAARRRTTEESKGTMQNGLRVTKRDRGTKSELDRIYNAQ